ncbi:MAG: hypothetical protein HYV03_07845 [Deltaproteobacteria bacterium]|nr:hypothetical protein [Deltaproteobacteria bacterium]
MRIARINLGLFLLAVAVVACRGGSAPFAVVRLVNPYADEPQHVRAVGFDAGGNSDGHFRIRHAVAGGRELGLTDLVIPAGGMLELSIEYSPRNLETTRAGYGGWETGVPARQVPQAPETTNNVQSILLGANVDHSPPHPLLRQTSGGQASREGGRWRGAAASNEATHRALVVLTYDYPQEGVLQIELIGTAVPGPNGEVSAAGPAGPATSGECSPSGTTACFQGRFSIELPGLMTAGPVAVDLTGLLPIAIDGNSATMVMNQFPPALFVVKGNGPGEPLEGKPIDAISIVISGAPDVVATGTFDSGTLSLSDLGFRIRIYLSELSLEAADAATAPADFLVTGLSLVTTTPAVEGTTAWRIETTLGATPSGNPLIDPFLGGARVLVVLEGTLQLP